MSNFWKEQEYCAVCDFPLDLGVFPDDYPEEFKFCCACRKLAEWITTGGEDARSPLAKKVCKKITLVS